jgi:hypothetical protein
MNLDLAFTGTTAGNFLFATQVLAGVKLASAFVQARLMRGNYKQLPDGRFFRMVYIIGKTTPALASGCAFASALALHDHFYAWIFGAFTIFVACLAIGVVSLRKRGRFFGVADVLSARRAR